MKFFPSFGLALLASTAFCLAQADSDDSDSPTVSEKGVTILHDVEIGTGGGRPLHAEIAYPTAMPAKPMPAVIWIHGGGWSLGSHKNNVVRWLTSFGYFTASVEYRLTDEAKWPAQIEDCKLAVRWLRANAAKYHVDPEKIGVWGSSAGGHLAVCLGTMGDQSQFEGKGGYGGVSSKVQAVVDFCGPVDFTQGSAGIQKSLIKPPATDAPVLLDLIGAGFQEKPDIWKQASPICYVNAGDPPFLIMHGDLDPAVPHEQSEKLAAALTQAGVSVDFITVKGASHGFKMRAPKGKPPETPDSKARQEAVLTFFDKYLK